MMKSAWPMTLPTVPVRLSRSLPRSLHLYFRHGRACVVGTPVERPLPPPHLPVGANVKYYVNVARMNSLAPTHSLDWHPHSHTRAHTRVHTYANTNIMYTCTNTCSRTCTRAHKHTHRVQAASHIHARTHAHTHTDTRTRTHVRTHARTHTHSLTHSRPHSCTRTWRSRTSNI